MAEFSGFPSQGRTVPLPAILFADLLPQITDQAELRVMLHLFWRINERRLYPRFLTLSELDTDRVLLASLQSGGPPFQELRRGLSLAVKRGTLVEVVAQTEQRSERLYFLNTEANRTIVGRIERGELAIGQVSAQRTVPVPDLNRPNAFALYEQNIGLLTPMIAEEIKLAEQEYPAEWIEEAFRVAVSANRRSWRYVSVILERWRNEGKDDGTATRHSARDSWERYYRPGGGAPPGP